MSIWSVILAAVVGLAVWRLDTIFPGALASEDGTGRLVYLAVLLAAIVLFGGSLRGLRLGSMAKMTFGWVALFAILVIGWSYRDDLRGVADRVRGEVVPSMAVSREGGEIELRRTRDGHYHALADVNGRSVEMLVDTGASSVVLSFEDAKRIGLHPETLSFSQPVSTANGRTHVARVTLDSVAVGPIAFGNVRGAVAAKGDLSGSLLGMSFLGRLSETSFRGDRLILRE